MNDPFMIGLARFMSIFFALSAVSVYVYSRCTPFGAENIWLTNMARPFGAELRGRLAAALARRGNERTEPWTGGVVLVLQLALCVCCYFGMLSLAATFAAYFALILAQQCVAFMVTHKSRIGTRVASLQPRMIARIVPLWSLFLPVVGWCASLVIGWRTGAWLPVLLSVGTSAGALALAFVMTSWPAIIGDQDTQADEAIDRALRNSRVRSLLLMAGIIPFAVSQGIWAPHDIVVIIARLVCVAAYLPMTLWYAKAVRTAQNDILRLDHAS